MNTKIGTRGAGVSGLLQIGGSRRGLLLLNLCLLFVLGVVSLAPLAEAQNGISGQSYQTMRVRGQYSVVGGESLGEVASTVFVLDSANRELVSLRWNDSTKSLEGIGFRDLVLDANRDPDR